MGKYSIIALSNQKNKFLVIANTYENPINDLISDDYVPFLVDGDVIFDLVIINGMNLNRFVGATIEQHRLLPETIRIIKNVPPEILKISKDFFMSNIHIVGGSSLPSATKYLLTN
ncbi:type II toxin-antitoxin system RnlB family antitoxin [Pectinatus frisingensis]|uniref:type II toxin-antitoxin system RnlB family antitoxin n=1 Tax=Pectinatus frisingensis TaxID=865 RepID=UPI0018C6B34E|nr:type II toxin-antitoxin system RnlB family antitoxin [Pectinatus frisingensis]